MTTETHNIKADNKSAKSLQSIIYSSYLTSSLIPIFTIEVVLLALYFSINWYISENSKKTFIEKVQKNIPHIVDKEATSINVQLSEISRQALFLQQENSRLFTNPKSFAYPKSRPKFKVAENGSYYKATESGCSLWYSKSTKIDKKAKRKAIATEVFDHVYQSMVDINENVTAIYFNSWDDMNRLCPYIKNVYNQYPASIQMEDYNFYYLADKKHNPSKKPVWTGAYLDPAGQGWMISCIVPIYNNDFLEGVTGLDVTIDKFVQNIINLDLPWHASAFLTDKNGTILAMPEKVERVLGLTELKDHAYANTVDKEVLKPEKYNLLKHKDKNVANQIDRLFKTNRKMMNLVISDKEYIIIQAKVHETSWKLMVLLDKDILFKPVYEIDSLSRKIGILAVIVMVVFYIIFFFFLQRKSARLSKQITIPIKELADATENLGTSSSNDFKLSGIHELDKLTLKFSQMTADLDLRTKQLIGSKIRVELKEQESKMAYNAGLFASASSYLHNIGNSLGAADGRLLSLNQILESTDQYPIAFKMIKESLDTSKDNTETLELLERLEEIVTKRAVPRLKENIEGIAKIQQSMVQSIRHQQATFSKNKEKMKKFVQKIDIAELIDDVLEELAGLIDIQKTRIHIEKDKMVVIKNQKGQLAHGLINLVKNSIESIHNSDNPENGKIWIEVKFDYVIKKAIIRIKDNGTGIPKENLNPIGVSGFTTKEDGHGLGLHSFINFLHENNGNLTIMSDGENKGAEFTVEIGDEQ